MRESPRLRRLRSDLRAIQTLKAESTILDFECRGNPPEWYLLRFHGLGLWRPDGKDTVLVRNVHEVSLGLGASYPRMMPELSWKTPIFHPNISGSGVVCLGGYGTYWVPSVNLDELCQMLWDMIRYQNFDVNSPYNREAALWAKTQKDVRLPLDPRPLRDRVAAEAALGQIPAVVVSETTAKKPPIVRPVPPQPHWSPRPAEHIPDVLFLEPAEPVGVGAAADCEIVFLE
jgi:ubiquitin-protein ligase